MRATLLICGLALAVGAGFYSFADPTAPHHAARAVLIAGLIPMARDPLDSLQVGAGSFSPLNPRRWVFAWTFAALFFAILSIIRWQGPTPDINAYVWNAIGAGVFGVIMVFLPFLSRTNSAFSPPFQESRPIDAGLLGRIVFYGFPVLSMVLIFGAAISPPPGGMKGVYPLFQMCFLPFLVQYFPIRAGIGKHWPHYLPRTIGLILLITALIIA